MTGRIALVTGGIRGIGRAVTLALSDAGYKVAAGYASRDEAAKMFTEDTGIPTYKWDVGDFEACAKAVAQIEDDMGGAIEVLVNNAGITRDNLLMRMKDEEWFDIMQTNLTSVFRMSKAVLRSMMKKRCGRIITIGSVVGSMGNAGQTNYAAAKAGVLGFTKSLAKEVASRGITVNAIAPGFIDTDMTKDLSDEQKQAIFSQVPANRLGLPEEIAATVAFLASRQAAYITGETIHVNGGMYMV
jgi:3-oxoacyl-[acyl-carrier protein] reductase